MWTYRDNPFSFTPNLKHRINCKFLCSRRSQSTLNFGRNFTLFICSSSDLHRGYTWDNEWTSNIEEAYAIIHSMSVLYHTASSIVLRCDQRVWSESFFNCTDLLSNNDHNRNAYNPVQIRLEPMCIGFGEEIGQCKVSKRTRWCFSKSKSDGMKKHIW